MRIELYRSSDPSTEPPRHKATKKTIRLLCLGDFVVSSTWEHFRAEQGLDCRIIRPSPPRSSTCVLQRTCSASSRTALLNGSSEASNLHLSPSETSPRIRGCPMKNRRSQIQKYYQRSGEGVQALYNRPYVYLSQAEMNRFVVETTHHLVRIYGCLWLKSAETGNLFSALSLSV